MIMLRGSFPSGELTVGVNVDTLRMGGWGGWWLWLSSRVERGRNCCMLCLNEWGVSRAVTWDVARDGSRDASAEHIPRDMLGYIIVVNILSRCM